MFLRRAGAELYYPGNRHMRTPLVSKEILGGNYLEVQRQRYNHNLCCKNRKGKIAQTLEGKWGEGRREEDV